MEKLDATNDNVSHPSGLKSDSSVLELATVREVEERWMCCFFVYCYSLPFEDLPFEVQLKGYVTL